MKKERNILLKRCRAKTVFVTLMVLIILFSIPSVSSVNISSTSKIVKNDNLSSVICKRITFPRNDEHFLSKPGRLVDNIKIRCYGTSELLLSILWMILGMPVWLINLEIISYNDKPITIHRHITLVETKNNRILYDFNLSLPWQLQPHWYLTTFLFTNKDWKAQNYIFGPFDLIYKLRISEDNSSTTVVFHGFVFVIGVKIFNSAGEKLE